MKKLAQVGFLCFFLGCEPEELTKHSKTVYEWRGILYEVTGKNKTAPDSHYSKYFWGNQYWFIRELGNKSEIYKQIKGGK